MELPFTGMELVTFATDNWITLATLAAGFTLIWVELYLPGGVLGLVGGIVIAVGNGMIYNDYGFRWGAIATLVIVILLLFLVFFWMKTFHLSYLGKRFTLKDEVGGDDQIDGLPSLVGKTGVTTSRLMPSGKAVIDGKRCDVVSQSGMIEADVSVKVVKVNGISVLVQPA